MQESIARHELHARRKEVVIPGVALDPETERDVWRAFGGWADHFRAQLASEGLPGLLADYEALIRSVETQSCEHVPGKRNTGAMWRSCCGMSEEYLNDLSVRDALQIILDFATRPEVDRLMRLIEPLDARLKVQLFASAESGAGGAGGDSRAWWHAKLPDVLQP